MLDRIVSKITDGERLEREELLHLMSTFLPPPPPPPGAMTAAPNGRARAHASMPPLALLGGLARHVRLRKADPDRVTYVVDRNINYTNVCVSGCLFCAFFRPPGHEDGYVISEDELYRKIEGARELGATQILLQGGMHPELRLDFYTGMLRFIKESFPTIHVHGFSPPEIVHIAGQDKTSIAAVISALHDAGLDSIPGGGAEILTDQSRNRVSPHKCSAALWLEVMEAAHLQGLRTSATMMFGHGETLEERVDHLLACRALQDRTGGFVAFIPWSFQPGNTRLRAVHEAGGHAYLVTLAVSRLALDNIDNIQASWVTQGASVAQAALFFGANDFGSTMIEENVVAAAGVTNRMSREEIEHQIRCAGFRPAQRDQGYRILHEGQP